MSKPSLHHLPKPPSCVKGHIQNSTHFSIMPFAWIQRRWRAFTYMYPCLNIILLYAQSISFEIIEMLSEASTTTNALFYAYKHIHTHIHRHIEHSITLRQFTPKTQHTTRKMLVFWRCWCLPVLFLVYLKKPFGMVHSNILLLHLKCLFSLFDIYGIV